MKKISLILFILLGPSVAFAETISITVRGMVCSFCAQGIKKTFGKREGIDEVKVDLESKLVVLKTKSAKTISDEEIKSLINDAGYDVSSIERKE